MKNPTIRQRTPGHYSSLLNGADSAAMIKAVAKPGVKGVMKRYPWNHLEPVSGQYDFSAITADLATCAALGLKLVVMVLDKTFTGPQRVLPKGMEAYEALNHGGSSTVVGSPGYGGYTALRWQAPVVIAANNLYRALGAAFNTNETYEGVAFVESSLSMDPTVMKAHGYTAEAYRDGLIAMLIGAAQGQPNSQVFWFQNFLYGGQQYLGDIADAVRPYGVTLCGPDALPTNAQLVAQVYPIYERFKGRMNMAIQMSTPGYSQLNPATSAYYTMDEMLVWIRETLYSDYIFWMPSGAGWASALPVIAAHPVINF